MLSIALLSTAALAAPPLTIVKDGKSTYSIVLASGASPSMKYGAKELQTHLRLMSGATLPIVDMATGRKAPKNAILLTHKALAGWPRGAAPGPESYRIKSEPNRLVIYGGALRGVMYGCYTLLDDVLGVRWFNQRVTRVPARKTIALATLDISEGPAFEYREPFFTEAFNKEWAARNKTNGNTQQLDDEVGGKVIYGKFVHTFSELVPPEQYYDEHPEYFSMIDGKRMKGYYQLCLTNPDVLRISIDRVRQWIKEQPKATIFSVSQNDTYSQCQCTECKKVEEEEGAPSGPVLRFVNAVADAIAKDHPGILIDTLAYQYTEQPPKLVKPHKNVRIRIAPIYACFGHPLDGCAENKTALNNLKNWAAITDQLYVWHYTTNFAHYFQPLPNLDEIGGDILLFKKTGVVGIFDEGGYAPVGGSDLAELKSYLLAKLMWEPTRDPKKLIDEYIVGVYGKAAPQMKEWIDLTHSVPRAGAAHPRIYDPPTSPYLAPELVQKGLEIFARAEQAAANDPKALGEVERTKLGLEYVQLSHMDPKDPAYANLAKVIGSKVRRLGYGQAREGEPIENFLKRIGQG